MCATCNHYLELIRLAKERGDYDTADLVKKIYVDHLAAEHPHGAGRELGGMWHSGRKSAENR